MSELPFTYDDARHEYRVDGRTVPHITGMLLAAGLVDTRWFTDEASTRGTHIHKLTADYDLGALELGDCVSRYRGYLLGYAQAVTALKPEFLEVEMPAIHPTYHYGGRPDRVAKVFKKLSIWEIKSGLHAPAHGVQTALQAILRAPDYDLPAELWARFCVYLGPTGRYRVEQHEQQSDFATARRLIRDHAHDHHDPLA